MSANTVALAYLIASVFFILALKGLSSPLTARRGNLFGMVGMAIAVVTTLTITKNWALILVCIGLGGTIGAVVARREARDRLGRTIRILRGAGTPGAVARPDLRRLGG